MNIKQRAVIGVLVVSGFIFFQVNRKSSENNLTKDDVNSIIETVEQSFIDAEVSVLKITPEPDITPEGPNPDPEKCICKGTGKIVQGDGHVSPCPYHAKTDSQPTIQTYIVPRFRLFNFLRPRG